MYLWSLNIFSVYGKILPYFLFCVSILTFFTQFHTKHWKIFGDSRHLRKFCTTACKKSKICRRFLPFVRCEKDFIWYWRGTKGKKLAYFCLLRGKELELLAKTFILALHASLEATSISCRSFRNNSNFQSRVYKKLLAAKCWKWLSNL